MSKNFEQWCSENNRQDLLDRWDYVLNKNKPNEISYTSRKKYYFKCPKHLHESKLYAIGDIYKCPNVPLKCLDCYSFYKWCIDNNRNDLLNLWDYKLNNKTPKEIFKNTNKKYYFQCSRDLHKSELKCIGDMTNDNRSHKLICNQCNSFGQIGIDNIDKDFIKKYWSTKNIISPFSIGFSSKIKVWIRCQEIDYHEDYLISCNDFARGNRCPYCAGKSISLMDSLGYLYPQVLEIWSDKNKKSPYEYLPSSHAEILWKCKDKLHNDYVRTIHASYKANFNCPECVREQTSSFLQEKVCKYISDKYGYKLNHERDCSIVPQNPKINNKKGQLPFDNEILDLKLIIEVNGSQHYKLNSWHKDHAKNNNTTPEYEFHKQKLHDRYKKFIAHYNGYFYLEISYLTEKDESYKQLIDNKINKILKIMMECG